MINIEESIRAAGFIPIELKNTNLTSTYMLKNSSFSQFIELVQSVNSSPRIYFSYFYYDLEDYWIDFEDELLSSKAVDKVISYNNHLKTLDLTRPYKAVVFSMVDTMMIGLEFEENWIEQTDVRDPEIILKSIEVEFVDDYFAEKMERRRTIQNNNQPIIEKLMGIILDDPEFAHKKNQHSRYWYYIDLMNRPDMEEFREVLVPYGAPHIGNLKMFLDEVWRLNKERIKLKMNPETLE